MRRRRSSPGRAPFYLLVVCIGLAWMVYWQIANPPAFPSDVAAADQPAASEPTRARQAEFSLPPLAEYSEIVARPLFSPTRRPPVETEADTDDASPPLSGLVLAGVVISTEGRLALLRRSRTAEVVRVLLGQEIDGWRVEAIESDRVTLRQGDTVEVVTLRDKAEEGQAQQGQVQQGLEVGVDEQPGVFEIQP